MLGKPEASIIQRLGQPRELDGSAQGIACGLAVTQWREVEDRYRERRAHRKVPLTCVEHRRSYAKHSRAKLYLAFANLIRAEAASRKKRHPDQGGASRIEVFGDCRRKRGQFDRGRATP